ncbi:MAG: SdiA-regulated domain-containing protein [Pseudomonas sp.]|uniref:SdiA-regulated domain-containing protein n=1 Tax=Pseudomonas sp. TaxID=306 RepID=UPI003D6F5F2F
MIVESGAAMSTRKAVRQRQLRNSIFVALLLGVLGTASTRFYWHQQLYHAVMQTWTNSSQATGLWLPGFAPDVVAKPIEGIKEDLSDITYDYDHDRLLAITNGGAMQIVALDRAGNVHERYPLEGFDDTEGLAYMGNGRVVVTEEGAQRLTFIELPEKSAPIRKGAQPFITVGVNLSTKNKGFEGVTYDPVGDRLFAIKERDPRQLYEINGVSKSLGGNLSINLIDRTEWVDRSFFGHDLADVYCDPGTGHLVLLSEESKLLIELDKEGRFISYKSLLEA